MKTKSFSISLHPTVWLLAVGLMALAFVSLPKWPWYVTLTLTLAAAAIVVGFGCSFADPFRSWIGQRRIQTVLVLAGVAAAALGACWYWWPSESPFAHPTIRRAEHRALEIEAARVDMETSLIRMTETIEGAKLRSGTSVVSKPTLADLKQQAHDLLNRIDSLPAYYDELVQLRHRHRLHTAGAGDVFRQAAQVWRRYAEEEKQATGYSDCIAAYNEWADLWDAYAIAIDKVHEQPLDLSEIEAALRYAERVKILLSRSIVHIDESLLAAAAVEKQHLLEARIKDVVAGFDALRTAVRSLTQQVNEDATRARIPNTPASVQTTQTARIQLASVAVRAETTPVPDGPPETASAPQRTAASASPNDVATTTPSPTDQQKKLSPPPKVAKLPDQPSIREPLTTEKHAPSAARPRLSQNPPVGRAAPAAPTASAVETPRPAVLHPFIAGTTWTGTTFQHAYGINSAENNGATIQVVLEVTEHDTAGFQGLIRYPSAVDGYGRRRTWGAEATCRGQVRSDRVVIATAARYIPAGTVLDRQGTYVGSVSGKQYAGTYSGTNASRCEFRLVRQ